MTTTTPLPSASSGRLIHPTAQAFFHAFDSNAKESKNRSNLVQKQSQTLGWRNRHSQSEWFPLTISGKEIRVRQVQRGEVEGTYGTGATVWPASLVLIKYLERNRGIVAGKSVVDLGAGTGVTSLAAAVLDASRVVCTDGTPSVVQLAKDNVQHNEKHIPTSATIQVGEYWWGDESLRPLTFDVILVSDCVLPKLYPMEPLIKAIDELSHENTIAVLSYEHRYFAEYDPRDKFRELCEQRGLQVRVIPHSEQDPVYSTDDIELWQVQRQR